MSHREDSSLKARVLAAAESAGQDFAFYDRKEDEELNGDELEHAVRSGLVTMDEIIAAFTEGMRRERLWPT